MSKLEIFNGTLEECEKRLNELEKTNYVAVVYVRSIMEQEPLFGPATTGFVPPKVIQWQMMFHILEGK